MEDEGATLACLASYAQQLQSLHAGLTLALLGTSNTTAWAARRLGKLLRQTATSSRPVVIGAGQGTTGTTSLALALQLLNFTVWHADRVYGPPGSPTKTKWREPIINILRRTAIKPAHSGAVGGSARKCNKELDALDYRLPHSTQALVDVPAPDVFLDLLWAQPKAFVILSTRPKEEWVERRIADHPVSGMLPVDRPCGAMLNTWPRSLSEALLGSHEQLVRCVTPPQRLLELCIACPKWQAGRGNASEPQMGDLARLASFLNVTAPVPIEFPHQRHTKAPHISLHSP